MALPDSFEDGALQYGHLLLPLVAEEVREQVSQGLQAVSKQPFARVDIELKRNPSSSYSEGEDVLPSGGDNERHLKQVRISPVAAGGFPPAASGVILDALGVRPTDLVLISTSPIQSPEELFQPHQTNPQAAAGTARSTLLYFLALVARPATDEAGERAFDATVLAPDGGLICQALGGGGRGPVAEEDGDGRGQQWFLTPVGNTATTGRMWEALRLMTMDPEAASTTLLMNRIFRGPLPSGHHDDGHHQQHELDEGGFDVGSPEASAPSLRSAVVRYCRDLLLNSSQTRAVIEVAEAAALPGFGPSFHSTGSLHLIQGPPGTGKTSTITRLILCLAGSGASVLVCAPTNVACQEIAARLLKELKATQVWGLCVCVCEAYRNCKLDGQEPCSSSCLNVCHNPQFASVGAPGEPLPGAMALSVGDVVLQVLVLSYVILVGGFIDSN